MKKEAFEQMILEQVKSMLGKSYDICLKTIMKNNDTKLTGLLIRDKRSDASPTIYLDSFYREDLEEDEVHRIALDIISCYHRNCVGEIDMHFFQIFDEVKHRICYKLISKERNENLLKEVPYIPFLDLAICFYYYFEDKKIPGLGSILIRNEHMEGWNVTTQTLYQMACINTPRLFPASTIPISDIVSKLATEQGMEEDLTTAPFDMFVITNKAQVNGAIALFYNGVIDELYEHFGCDFYILPSSVHELIVLPETAVENVNYMQEMVKTINETQVSREDYLSDSIYKYDGTFQKVGMIYSDAFS